MNHVGLDSKFLLGASEQLDPEPEWNLCYLRQHLGSVLATPHILWNLLTALGSHNRYRELIQRI